MDRNELRDDIRKKAITYIELGADQRRWKESGFLRYLARKRVLNNLRRGLLKTHVRTEYKDIDQEDVNNERFNPGSARYHVYQLLDNNTGKPYYIGNTINLELRSRYFERYPMRKK
jgi:hypothetical protein